MERRNWQEGICGASGTMDGVPCALSVWEGNSLAPFSYSFSSEWQERWHRW